ncbi:MAG: hypothetical protein HC828_14700 [Blastochloris sp.]|nr:hypothetical protein [Blastochloris sp.]
MTNRLNSLIDAATTIADIARRGHTYRFPPTPTLYLHVGDAEIVVKRHAHLDIEIGLTLQAPFAWRIGTDQDEAGVYFVIARRPLVGALASAQLIVSVPSATHVMLRLASARLTVENLSGIFELPANTSLTRK